uniref:Uncharacterized protein n=1 Tax=Knipowitschia caucasica TaxID=637954 RepID=A0AAV2LZX8_KNICA
MVTATLAHLPPTSCPEVHLLQLSVWHQHFLLYTCPHCHNERGAANLGNRAKADEQKHEIDGNFLPKKLGGVMAKPRHAQNRCGVESRVPSVAVCCRQNIPAHGCHGCLELSIITQKMQETTAEIESKVHVFTSGCPRPGRYGSPSPLCAPLMG